MKILVVNCGSSSLKCTLFAMPQRRALASCMVEKIGEGDAALTLQAGQVSLDRPCHSDDHEEALDVVLDCLLKEGGGVLGSLDEIAAVGHRLVHGGEKIADISGVAQRATKGLW